MSTYETLNKDTNPSVYTSYYNCPVTGTKNITISLNFKDSDKVFKLPTLTTTGLTLLSPTALMTENIKPLNGNQINPIPVLTTADLKFLETPLYLRSSLDDEILPYHCGDKWYSEDYKKPAVATDKLNYALESLNLVTQKQKKQEILKQIQSLLEKLVE
jgi:hypothetical protein